MLPRAALRKLLERDFEVNRVMKEMNMNRLRSFRVATSLLAFCLLAWFSPATATAQKGGTTHEVGVDGDIQAAIEGASDGDTIQLAAGQYDITTTIDPDGKQVTILGTVDGNGDPTSILDGGNPVESQSASRLSDLQIPGQPPTNEPTRNPFVPGEGVVHW